jgi:hypothetical protein
MPLDFSRLGLADCIETKDRVGCFEDERIPSRG